MFFDLRYQWSIGFEPMLTIRTFPLRNLTFHWRGNLPVLLGAMVGAAVLTGALLVGDSLRGSLRARADRQLNGVQSAWLGTRFIRAEVAKNIPDSTPAILLTGTVECDGRRATKVTVVSLPNERSLFPGVTLANGGACLSHRLADHLAAKAGATIRVSLEKPSAIPRGSLLGKREADDTTLSLRLPVASVLPVEDPANDFSLSPSPGLPAVIYLPLDALQQRLGKAELCNAILSPNDQHPNSSNEFTDFLSLSDWGVKLRTERAQPTGKKVKGRELPYVSVESDRLVLDPATVNRVIQSTKSRGLTCELTTSYLANAIFANGKEIPYSIVTALTPNVAPPLGPFKSGNADLADDEIILVDWPESPIKGLKPGDPVTIKYFEPETEGGAKETTATFKYSGSIPLYGVAADPSLTPPFAGITDKLSVRDWKPPFPYDATKIKPNDVHELYWQDYRTTPKAYISRKAGEKLFASRYGTVTSIRVAPKPGLSVEQTAEALTGALRDSLDPLAAGFVFENVAERLRVAGKGGQDFGGLFLGFSFFLIISALLLIGLLFRLAVEQRSKEVGLLLATGYSPKVVRRLILAEGFIIAAAGSALGVAVAVPYTGYLLKILVSLWPDPSVGTFLTLHVSPVSLVIGWALGLFTAILAMFLALRSLLKVSPPQLLRGTTGVVETSTSMRRWPVIVAISFASVAVGLLVGGGFATNPDAKAGCFFGGGAMLLTGGMLLVRAWLRAPREKVVNGVPALAIRNATRNPGRSLLTVSLVASAAFLLAAVESFRRPPPPADWKGYTLIAESDVPLFQSFGNGPGLDDLMLGLEKAYADKPTDEPTQVRLAKAKATLVDMAVVPIRVHGGDDASCLNLYQAGKPRVIGVPKSLLEPMPAAKADGIPTAVEQNTMMWMLKKGMGDSVELPNGSGEPTAFRLVQTLTDSPFQSELLIDDDAFRVTFPKDDGFRMFLISVPTGRDRDVSALLETGLAASGLTVTPVKDKVAGFQAVIGAYLTLFQLLGGFGLLLGVAGLAVVLLRSVWERSGELALLQAVGYSRATVIKMVLIENVFLLLLGLVVGTVSAAASVAPHRLEGATIPWQRLAVLLGGVLVAGVVAVIVATFVAVRRPVVPGLRAE
jgi:putative ABC transport system permease protein